MISVLEINFETYNGYRFELVYKSGRNSFNSVFQNFEKSREIEMKVKFRDWFKGTNCTIQIKTTTVYLAPNGNLLVYYKVEDQTEAVKQIVAKPLEVLFPKMNLE